MGDTNSAAMLASTVVSAGATIAGSYSQSQAIDMYNSYQKQQSNFNIRLAEMQARNAILRGDKAAVAYKKQAKGIIGSQRVALAAQGVSVNEGSALELQKDTKKIADVDMLTIKNNAWQEAWGYKMQALSLDFQSQFADQANQFASKNTLLSGVAQAANNSLAGYVSFKNAGYQAGPVKANDFKVGNTREVPSYYKTGGVA